MKLPNRISLLLASGLLTGALGLTGCAGYRVGSMLPGDITSVFVPVSVNQTGEPLVEVDATKAIIRAIQRDGSLTIAPESEADAVLVVTVTDYRLAPVAFRKDIRTAANQYRILMTASFVMRRTSDESVVVESPSVLGEYVFDVFGDLSSSKLTGNPRAAEDLARNIVNRMVEYWK
jgi:hypothetical protein